MWTIVGKTVLITGATRGVGLEAAMSLARLGGRLILVGRHPQRLAEAFRAVHGVAHSPVSTYLCDLSSLTDVRALVAAVRRDQARIDVILNNAGGAHPRRTMTVDGIEATFATNHLSHFLLTTALRDRLVASAPARVITVASVAHRQATLDFDDLRFAQGYGIMRAYNRSKLANVMFANELARRLAGTGVTSNSVHPGTVATNIWSGAPFWARPVVRLWLRWASITAAAGADAVVRLAVDPDLGGVTGQYFEGQTAVAPSPLAQDEAVAARLWAESERLVAR